MKRAIIGVGLIGLYLFRKDLMGAYAMDVKKVKTTIDHIKQMNPEIKAPTPLILAIAEVESNFNPKAESYAGAKGIMQLMPSTYSWILDKYNKPKGDIYNMAYNILAGSLYLTYLIEKYGWINGIMAYNMGPYNIKRGRTNYRYLSKVVERMLRWIF